MLLIDAIIWECFQFRWNVSPDFRSNKSKSSSSITISYPWPIKILVRYKSSVVTMNLGGWGKSL